MKLIYLYSRYVGYMFLVLFSLLGVNFVVMLSLVFPKFGELIKRRI